MAISWNGSTVMTFAPPSADYAILVLPHPVCTLTHRRREPCTQISKTIRSPASRPILRNGSPPPSQPPPLLHRPAPSFITLDNGSTSARRCSRWRGLQPSAQNLAHTFHVDGLAPHVARDAPTESSFGRPLVAAFPFCTWRSVASIPHGIPFKWTIRLLTQYSSSKHSNQ